MSMADPFLPFTYCLPKAEVVDACNLGRKRDVAHPPNVGQSRLRRVEEYPIVEQVDAITPAFDLLAAPDPPVETGAELRDGELEVAHPDVER